MIEKIEVFKANCDKCKKPFSNSDCEYNVEETKDGMIETLEDADWQIKGDKVFCDDCRTY